MRTFYIIEGCDQCAEPMQTPETMYRVLYPHLNINFIYRKLKAEVILIWKNEI